MHEPQPIIIDNGTGTIKSGFASSNTPQSIFPTLINQPNHNQIGNTKNAYIGTEAQTHQDILNLSAPIERGIIKNWTDIETIWDYTLSGILNVMPEEHPVLLTDVALTPKANRAKMTEIMFERFAVPGLYISMQSVLSLYASGRTTGMVLSIGHGVCQAIPIYDGYALPHAVRCLDVAGGDLDLYLLQMLEERCDLRDKCVVRRIKEEMCYVAGDFEEEMKVACGVRAFEWEGGAVTVGNEGFRCPEALFRPDLVGLEDAGVDMVTYKSIHRCNIDVRNDLYGNILLAGGCTMLDGFSTRFNKAIKSLAPRSTNVKVAAPPYRYLSTWIGGSIIASLENFQHMWISKDEYEEKGPSVHMKCF